MISRLVARLLSCQEAGEPHTLLTGILVSGIILFASLVYAGFFGVLASVAVYLLGVELAGWPLGFMFVPFYLSLLIGSVNGLRGIVEYWRHNGHD